MSRTFFRAVLCLMVGSFANAAPQVWYDVPAVNRSLSEQLIAISTQGSVQLLFMMRDFDWDSPATHNVHGWFTPTEAFCLALAGTPMVPVQGTADGFALVRSTGACEYTAPDFGTEWIHPPQADWE